MGIRDDYRLQSGHNATAFFSDLVAGFLMSDLWRTFAWDEVQKRYRRSMLGVVWIVVSYAILVGGVSIFFSAFSSADPFRFLTHVAIGYAAFNFFSSNITDGCRVFSGSANWIKSISLPYSIYVYKTMFRSIYVFSLQMTVALAVMLASGWRPSLVTLYIFPAMALYLINAVPIQYALGLLSARYRDLEHLVSSIMRLMIFMTPILWVREERTGIRADLADLNPFTHFLEVFRAPLMDVAPRLISWEVVLGVTVFVWVAAIVIAISIRRRLPYWL
jgi:ABC-type polysaccharide/polyol phosphate export permease|tara:strand:+ start:14980 stop:15804 length:825 start_codon:yes stop_codon:yes gene_type:complete